MPVVVVGGVSRLLYATVAELDGFLADTAPAEAESNRLLARASERVDTALRTAVYAVDATGAPTETTVIAALRDATCAQVEFWLSSDEEDDVLGPTQGYAVGGLQVQYGAGDNRITPTYLAPRAAQFLRACPLIRW